MKILIACLVLSGCAASLKEAQNATTCSCAGVELPQSSENSLTGNESSPPAEVRTAEKAPKKTAPSGQTVVTLLAQGKNAFLGKLELSPHAKVPENEDPTEEYIHVLSGYGVMMMNGNRYEIQPGTTIYMPAHARVSFENGNEPLTAIQVFAGPEPAQKYSDWK
jgi:quercetin dioxygenase-like cupin family protein